MGTPVSTIRNLGPASEALYARAGIRSAQELHDLGADAAYEKLLETGARPHFIGYYALVMGLQGRPWNDCHGSEKQQLRARFDSICAKVQKADSPQKGRHDLEAALDRIGVVKRAAQPTISRPEK